MSERCTYRKLDGLFCKRWASEGSRFCHCHTNQTSYRIDQAEVDELHPLARLATVNDLFDVVRETLNAARQGRISPGQTYAVGYMVDLWLRTWKLMRFQHRDEALLRQTLGELLEQETAASQALAEAPPLPVQFDQKAQVEHYVATSPQLPLVPLSDYPGWEELQKSARSSTPSPPRPTEGGD